MSSPYGGTDPNSNGSYPGAPGGGGDAGNSYPGAAAGGSPAPDYGSSAPQSGGYGAGTPGGPGTAGGYGTGTPDGPKKSKTGRNVIIGCVIALVAALLLGGCGALALWGLGRGGGDGTETTTTSAEQSSSEESTTEDTTSDSSSSSEDTSSAATQVDLQTGETGEVPSVETDQGNHTPTNGAFAYVDITLTNTTDQPISFSPDAFTLVDESGTEHPVAVGTSDATSTELAAGESATARLYADVAPGTKISSVNYNS